MVNRIGILWKGKKQLFESLNMKTFSFTLALFILVGLMDGCGKDNTRTDANTQAQAQADRQAQTPAQLPPTTPDPKTSVADRRVATALPTGAPTATNISVPAAPVEKLAGATPSPTETPTASVPATQPRSRTPVEQSPNTAKPGVESSLAATLPQDQVSRGLKEALAKGVENAIAMLGKDGGFLTNLDVKIPMPASLKKVETVLRTLKQDKMADDFVITLNRAAEKAVPEAAAVLGDSIKQLTVADAQAILTGPNTAATDYFRKTSETSLAERLMPIVSKATSDVGVTAAYKKMMSKASFAGTVLGPDSGDIDGYVTHKALDGLFLKIAEEEKRIRENPVARTTDLLKSVFGKLKK